MFRINKTIFTTMAAIVVLALSTTAKAQIDISSAMESAVASIGGALYQGVSVAQAAAPNQNILPACPSGQSPAALQSYLSQTPGLDAAIASGNNIQAQNLIAAAIAACPNGIATITPGIANP